MEVNMELRILGTTDIKISPIIMGTWQTGKDMWVGIDDAESTKALKAAYDSGITTFDTAEVYGDGHSEKIVGKALKQVRSNEDGFNRQGFALRVSPQSGGVERAEPQQLLSVR